MKNRLIKRTWLYPGELKQLGILGLNARNAHYLFQSNKRKCHPLVDDKSITKRICKSHNIPVPETYAIIERYGDIKKFKKILGDHTEFVIKPARGSEGRGILIISQRNNDY